MLRQIDSYHLRIARAFDGKEVSADETTELPCDIEEYSGTSDGDDSETDCHCRLFLSNDILRRGEGYCCVLAKSAEYLLPGTSQ